MTTKDNAPVFVYSTVETLEQAESLGEKLVTLKLAACVNIIPGVRSIYEWQGKLEKTNELALLIKTNTGRLDELLKQAKALHPYDVPALVVLPITGGDDEYLAWAKAQIEG